MFYYKKKDMYIFTPEEKSEAHNISTTDYLSTNYGLSFKKDGKGYRCIEHNSLVVNADDKAWFWNSLSVGGGDIIAFVSKIDDSLDCRAVELSYEQSLKTVLKPISSESNTYHSTYKKGKKQVVERKSKEIHLPPKKQGRYNRLFAYLIQSRKLDKDIVSCLCKHHYLYEDQRGNVVFVGKDKNKEPKYGAIRGTLTDKQYRKECTGSDKANGFYLQGYDKETLFVFEAPIDMLSHATLINIACDSKTAWLNSCRLSLGCVSDTALAHYLQEYPTTRNIVFCLDNDKAGIEATEKYMQKYSDLGYNVSNQPSSVGKDYNDELVQLKNNKAVTSHFMK